MKTKILIFSIFLICCQHSPCEKKALLTEKLILSNYYQKNLRFPNQDYFFGYPLSPIQDVRLEGDKELLQTYLSLWLQCCKSKREQSQDSDEEIYNAEDEVFCITPLMLAARLGDESTTRFLLNKKIDINKKTTSPFCENNIARTAMVGQTALHYAALGGHQHLVDVLQQHGADASATNSAGQTAAQLIKNEQVIDNFSHPLIGSHILPTDGTRSGNRVFSKT